MKKECYFSMGCNRMATFVVYSALKEVIVIKFYKTLIKPYLSLYLTIFFAVFNIFKPLYNTYLI